MRRGNKALGFAALAAAGLTPGAFAGTYVGSAANPNWDNTDNWVGNTLPAPGDDVIISDTTAWDGFDRIRLN